MLFNFQSPVAHDGLLQILQNDLIEHNIYEEKSTIFILFNKLYRNNGTCYKFPRYTNI